ncbi:MAG: NADPH-dependent 7-cyano-7-deazaguanine reductase QueF [Colwellia sp.]|nr:NADPH-dependent 7-cyano-7-deazaguanine reductase QueF [Colwellia sp.]
MANYQNSKDLTQLTLGKETTYTSKYNADLLQAVPRSLNRDDLELQSNNLPFKGEDVWYGYELSWLNTQGKPIVAVAEFRFPCASPNLVESKSFKLYLNSFNQSKFTSWQQVEEILVKDLSMTSGSPAQVRLFKVDKALPLEIADINANCIDDLDVVIKNYDYDNLLLKGLQNSNNEMIEENLVSHLLKSNCLITNQPDWASIFIKYKGAKINHQVLLEYIISFRQHNEFHEQCVERIFIDLSEYGSFEELTIFARYTRRGGLDINPFRSSTLHTAPNLRTLRQ